MRRYVSPAGSMASHAVHPHTSPLSADPVPTTHFPSTPYIPHPSTPPSISIDSPIKRNKINRNELSNRLSGHISSNPTTPSRHSLNPTTTRISSNPNTPTRHSHTPTVSHLSSYPNTPVRHSITPTIAHNSPPTHPSVSRYSVARCPSEGVTLSPASSDTSKIIHEKNKTVTIVLGEQHVTYSSPENSRNPSIIKVTDDGRLPSPATYQLNSLTSINTANNLIDNNNLPTSTNGINSKTTSNNPILPSLHRQPSYNSTAYTSNGGHSTYNSAKGLIKVTLLTALPYRNIL